MKRQLTGCLILLSLSGLANAVDNPSISLERDRLDNLAQEDQQAREIIRRADRVRAPDQPFRYRLTLLEHKGGAT